jgi:hypothetical protein
MSDERPTHPDLGTWGTDALQALDSMSTTITTLETEVGKSREYLDRVSTADQRLASGALDIESGNPSGLR